MIRWIVVVQGGWTRGRPVAPGRDSTGTGGENPGLVSEQHFTDILRESADLPRSPDLVRTSLNDLSIVEDIVINGVLAARGVKPPRSRRRSAVSKLRCLDKQFLQFSCSPPPIFEALFDNFTIFYSTQRLKFTYQVERLKKLKNDKFAQGESFETSMRIERKIGKSVGRLARHTTLFDFNNNYLSLTKHHTIDLSPSLN